MSTLPYITPLANLQEAYEVLNQIYLYKSNNWAIGQLYPSGGPDPFTYFFAIRDIPIATYLRGTISIGNPSAYDKNIAALTDYIETMTACEIALVNKEIQKVLYYQERNWAIGEAYPDSGPDEFVVFFGQRHLLVSPYLVGTVSIGSPDAYCKNLQTLCDYKQLLLSL